MKLSLILSALVFPFLVLPSLLMIWLAASLTACGRRFAFSRR